MPVNCLKPTICVGALLLMPAPVWPQIHGLPAETPFGLLITKEAPIVKELRFSGLHRIAPAAVAAQIASHSGDRFDLSRIEKDVRALARLGWFESIQVEARPSAKPFPQLLETSKRVTLVFHVVELPFLSKVEYSGSRLLSQKQIEKLLEDKKLAPGLGKPADPAALQRIAFAIRTELNELGHPEAGVRIDRKEASNATVTVRFEINDGPLLRVRRVNFDGHPLVSTRLLRGQMRDIAPWKPLASWRGKNAFTSGAFEQDRQRILAYYQDHGFPEARIGDAQVIQVNESTSRWFPWPHGSTLTGLSVSVQVEAGPFYRFESIAATDALQQSAKEGGRLPVNVPDLDKGAGFSQQEIDKLKRLWMARVQSRNSEVESASSHSVEVVRTFDPENHTARVVFDLSDSPPYIVKRIEFQGLHKYSDRYVRRRIPLREGHPIDDRDLEAGLLRLARTGYFKPIHKEDIRVQF